MIFLGRTLMRAGFDVVRLIGARSATKHLSDELLKGAAVRLSRATDDGSLGHHGLVTDLPEGIREHWIKSRIHMRSPRDDRGRRRDVSKEFDVACQVSLEEYMACGIGICVGCVVRVENAEGKTEYGDYKRICVRRASFLTHAKSAEHLRAVIYQKLRELSCAIQFYWLREPVTTVRNCSR